MSVTHLSIENENNKLLCGAFVQVGPAPGKVTSAIFQKLYAVTIDGETRLYELVDFVRLTFMQVSTQHTLPATGLEAHEWRDQYRSQYPGTTDDTPMAVYYFRLKG